LDTFRQKDIIAILWTDLIVTDNNMMYYHAYTDDDDSGDRTLIDNVLTKASSNIDYYRQTSGFRASCVYVATWENARLYGYTVSI